MSALPSFRATCVAVLGFAALVSAQPLTTLDYKVTGQIMAVTPAVLSVPKGVAGSVGITITGTVPVGSYVEAYLRGPSFPARRLVGAPNAPLMLPPLNLPGDYSLDGIRLASATGDTLLEGTPNTVPVKVFDELLVSRVTSRPLTLDEIQERGIDIDESNFRAVEFEVGFVVEGQTFPVKFPVIAPNFKQTTEIIPAAELEARTLQAELLNQQIAQTVDLPPELETVMPQIQVKGLNVQFVGKEEDKDLALSIPPIPALMVIPGNIGFLNQFFSVQIFTENAAPNGSGLSVHSLTAEMVLPKGADLAAGTYEAPGDDPLRFVRVNGVLQTNAHVRAAGPDGKPGTEDDIDRLQPGQTGQGELLVEGLQEGLHVMELELKAKLDGLAAGTVDVIGKAAGSVLVRNPKFSMAFTHPRTVNFNEPYEAVVTVLNTSATVANLVSVELNRNNISGGLLDSPDRVELGNIAPGETKAATFRIIAQRTGAITFSNLTTSDDSVVGRFRLKTGVDERGVALSPDSLTMPDFFNYLPQNVRHAAQRVMGQALASNTAGQLPPGVLRVSKRLLSASFVKGPNGKPVPVGGGSMPMALLEAAQRLRYGDSLSRVLPDLLLDWQGARDFDPGWDQIMRGTEAGRLWHEALMLAMENAVPGPDHAVTRLVDRGRDLAGRGEAWMMAASDRGGMAMSFLATDGKTINASRSEVAKSGVFHGEEGQWLALTDANGVITWRTVDAASPARLSFMRIEADGTARELFWNVGDLPAGARVTYDTSGLTNDLQIDANNDGTVDGTHVATATTFTELPPGVIAVRQDPEVLVGRPPDPCDSPKTTNENNQDINIRNYGNILAVLFSKPMTQASVDYPAAFRLENGNEAAFVKMQQGGRVALLTMRLPVGGLVERHMTVQADVKDARGNAVVTAASPVLSRLVEGVKVNGRVIRADGSFAANVPVTLTYNDEIESGFGDCDPWTKRVAQVRTDASGHFAFDFVLGGIPYTLSATDTSSLSEQEIAVIMESSVNGEVQSEKLAELIASSEDSLLEIFAVSVMPEAIAKAEGLDRAIINDEALPERFASESTYALRFRGRGTVTGKVVLADGVTPVAGAAANLFPDVNSRELGRGILTDTAGRFAFQGVPLGPFTIEAMTPTGLTRTVSGLLSSTGQTVEMVISLGPTPPIYSDWQGRLQEPDGTAVSGGTVYVGQFENEELQIGKFTISGRTTSDANGYWSIPQVPVGTYSVIGLSLDGKRSGQRGPIASAAGVPTTANVVIQARTVVQGVVQFANGDPVAGAKVGGGSVLATTDALGRFTLTGVPTGPNREITAGLLGDELASDPRKQLNRITSARLNVQAGENFAVLRFPSVGRIVGQVLDENGAPVPNEVVALPFPKGEDSYFMWVETDAQGRYEAPGLSLNGPIGGAYDLSAPAPAVKESFDGAGMAALLKSASSEEMAAIIGKAFEAFTGVNDPLLNGGGPFNPAGWGFVKSVRLDFDGETEVANIRYLRRSVISGTVKNGQGVPIGARVRLTGVGPNNIGQPSFIIRAERNSDPALGTFAFNGDAFLGDWGLQAASPFFPVVVSTQGRTTSVDPDVSNVLLQFPAVQETNGSLTGQVLAVGGAPAGAGVQVSISSGGDPRVLTTDASGRFSTGAALYSLPGNRTYRVTAFDPASGGVAEGYAYVTASQDNQITLTLLGRGNIEITVQRADGTPVAGAAVDVQGGQHPRDRVTGTTNASGVFTASNVFEGPYSVSASATIGLSRSAGRAGFVVARDGTGTATVRLSSTATVTGTFVTTNGVTPISFANVRLGTLAYAPTDANGRFTFSDVPLGGYVLTAVDPVTGRGGNATVSLSTNGETRDVRIVETTLGTVSGLVINSFGSATVPNAVVNLAVDDVYALTRNFSVTSGPDGGYSIAGVAAGSFRIRADGRLPSGAMSGEAGEVRATLPSGVSALTVDIPFQPRANIIATVMEADGVTPATNAAISLSGPSSATRDTDAQGRVTFGSVPLGVYKLNAISRTPGRTRDRAPAVTVNLSARGADQPVTLNLLGIGTVSGVVYLGDGTTVAPGAEAKVEVRAVDQMGTVMDSVVVGTDGAFSFTNLPAALPVTLSAKFLGLAASETVTVSNGGTTTRNLILTASGTVEGRVLRADGSTIAAGAEVTITFPSRSGLQGAMLQLVGADGRFSFSPIPQGSYSVQAADPDHGGIQYRSGTIAVNDETDELGDIVMDEDFPQVIATVPARSTEGVEINSNIVVTFSEELKASSVNATGVFVRPAAGGAAVPATVTRTAFNVVTINPTAPLESSTAYQIVVVDGDLRNAVGAITNTGPRDLVDRQLNALFTATFVTRDQKAPEVASFTPAPDSTQVDPATPLRLTFNEPIQPGATITLTGPGGAVAGTTSLGVNNLVLAFVPTVPLLPNQVYTTTVSGIRDLAGNLAASQPLSATFHTLDTLGPVISHLRIKGGVAPASGATVLIEAELAQVDSNARYRLSANAVVVGTSAAGTLEVPVTLPVEGSVLLRGIAIDIYGNEGPLTEFTVTVQPNQPPVITMTRINPASGPVATNGAFSIRISAADDAGVTSLKAAVVGAASVPLRTSTGADITLAATVRADAGPNDTITVVAEATDSSGFGTGEQTFTIPLSDGTAPTLAFASAIPAATFDRGQTVTIPVRGQDNFGVTRYTLSVSGAFTASSEVTVDPAAKDDTRNLTLTVPNDAAQTGAGFTVSVRAFDAAGLGSTTISTTNLRMVDLTPPQISTFSPLANSTGITTRITPTVTFNEAVDPATVTTASVQLLLDADSSVVPSAVSLNAAGTVATLTPTALPLLPGTRYRVAVGTGVTDVAGNALAAVSNVSFTTAGFSITAPVANAQVVEGQPLTISLTEAFSFLSPREVRFFVNGTQDGVDTGAPFSRVITMPAPTGLTDGALPLRADLHATSGGALMASATVTVIVRGVNDDSDSDGIPNGQEILAGLDPFRNDAGEDPDGDTLTNAQEIVLGTKVNDADTDDDFLNDGVEVTATTNPLDADTDDDLIIDGRESVFGTNPKLADTDGDTLSDGFEIGFGRISVVSGSFTWAQAKVDAEGRGGHLLTITSALENTALVLVNPTIRSTGPWIGYTDQHVEGQFRWVTGESGTFTNFGTGQPDNFNNEDFAHFQVSDGTWNDNTATRTANYALETGFFTDPTLQDTDNDGVRDDVDTSVGTQNVAPIAGADSFLRNLGDSFSTSVSQLMGNDFDPNGDVMAFMSFTQPASGGTLTQNGNVLSLSTDPGFTGTISFTYTIQDPDGLSVTGNVSVSFVNNTVPIAGLVRPVRASLSFDGSNDSATTTHYAAFDEIETAAGVTFESWLLTRSYTSNHSVAFDKLKVAGDFGWHMTIDRTGPGLTLFPSSSGSVAANTIPPQNSWVHLAISLNQSTRETVFYVNGVEVRRATAPSTLVDTGAGDPLFFGTSPSGGDEFTNGLLGEVRLWKRILTGDDIRSRMNVQTTGTETDLAAAWSFDAGSGVSVANQVSGGLPAIFSSGGASPTWSTFAPPVNQRAQDETAQTATPVLIALQGSDADGHAVTATITSLPTRGQLFQFSSGAQGDAITAANTAVTDAQRRVVYVSNAGVQGADRFVFTVTDTLATSLPAVVSLSVSPSAEAAAVTAATIAHYRFEPGTAGGALAAITDSGPLGLHGTVNGTLTHTDDRPAAPANTSLALNATGDANFGTIPHHAMMEQQGSFTIETFYKMDSPYDNFGSPGSSTIVNKVNTTAGSSFMAGFELAVNPDTGFPSGTISFTTSTGTGVAGTRDTRDGQWHHLAMVLQRDVNGTTTDELRLYLDGALVGTSSSAMPTIFWGTQPLYIGAGNYTSTTGAFRRNFDGFIDEVRYTGMALAPGQFLNAAPGVPAPVIDAWSLAQGSTVTASSAMLAGSSADNAFDNASADAVFADGAAAGFTHFIEWQTPSTMLITSASLTADDDGPGSAERGFTQMRLFGRRTGSDPWTALASHTPSSNPYFGSVYTSLLTGSFAGSQFRAEFDAAEAGSGPRVEELDGIGVPVFLQTDTTGTQIGLQNGTATFSQASYSPAEAVDLVVEGTGTGNGWAVWSGTSTSTQTAVFESGGDLVSTTANDLIFQLRFPYGSNLLLGRFRLSATTDARSQFADGLANGGDVTANWTALEILSVEGTAGMTFTVQPDKSVLVGGTIPTTSTYTVRARGMAGVITGFRLEALEDVSLPTNGPGWANDGNFVLNEMSVFQAQPFIANHGPRGLPDSFTANQDFSMRTAGVMANDSDPEGNLLSIASFTSSTANGGSVAHVGNGVFDYMPAPGFSGTDTFTYRITDGFQTSAPVTVTITVAPANIVRWASASSGPWTTASNWSPARVPTSSDTVLIDVPGTYIITLSSGTQSPVGIVMGGAGVTASLSHTGGVLSPARDSLVKQGSTYTLAGGNLGGTFTLTVEGSFGWTSGVMTGSGRLVIGEDSVSTISGGGQKRFDTATRILENRGTLTYNGSGIDSFNNNSSGTFNSRIINTSTGEWIFDGDGDITALRNNFFGSHTSISFENAGAVKRRGTGTTTLSSDSSGVIFTNTGTVQVEEGSLQVSGGGSMTVNTGGDLVGAVSVSGGALILNVTTSGMGAYTLSSGSISVSGTATLNALTMSGGSFGGTGVATVTTGFAWSGGSLVSSGQLVLGENAISTITGTGQKRFDTTTRILENRGLLTYSGSGIDSLNNNSSGTFTSRIINTSTGEWVFDGDGDITALRNNFFGSNSSISFENAGVVKRRGAGTTTLSSDSSGATFTNTGTVQVEAGALQLSSGGTLSGLVNTAAGTTLLFSGGTMNVNTGGDIAGPGPVTVNGGTLVFNTAANSGTGAYTLSSGSISVNGTTTLNALTMSGGSFGGTGVATVTLGLTWSGGSMASSGRLILAEGSISTISGTGQKRFDTSTRILENRGLLTYSGSGIDSFNNNTSGSVTSRIINTATGEWVFDGDGDIFAARNNNWGSNSSISFENAGLVRRLGAGTTTLSSDSFGVPFTNTGTVQMEAGALQLSSGGTVTGPINVAAGTTLFFSGGTTNINIGADISGPGPVTVNGGALVFNTAANSGTGTYTLSSGSMAVNGTTTLNALTLSGGSFGGTGVATITTGLTWSGGSMTSSGRLILAEGSISTISGTGQKRFDTSTRILENRGLLTYSGSGIDSFNNNTSGSVTSRIINTATGEWVFDGDGDIFAARNNNWGSNSSISFENAGLVKRRGAGATTLSSDSHGVTFTNSGTVKVEAGTLQLSNGITQSAANAEVQLLGGSLSGSTGGTLTFAGGKITGVGTISTSIVNSGATISPDGNDTRSIHITGTYTQQSGGRLEMDLDSDAATEAFDKLVVDGAATLNGSVLLRNNLALSGEVFPLVTYASRSGSFGSITTSNAGTATATYLASRADFTVTADAPAAPAPELAASYEDWIDSVEQTWGDGGNAAASFPAPAAEGEDKPVRTRRVWNPDPMADPDGDGAVNLLEYAFQTNPLHPGSIARLETRADSTRPGGLEISHRMRAAAVDVSYVIEYTTDLKTWQPLEEDVSGYEGASTQPVSNGTQMRNIRIDASRRPNLFLRVQVIPITP